MNLSKKIIIDGKFLTEKLTGIQRYAVEIVAGLDKICGNVDVELLVPFSLADTPEYKNIKVIRYGKLNGLLWQQLCLPFYLYRNRARCLSLCNIIPVLKPNGFSAVHDISYAVNSRFFTNLHSRLSRYWHMLNYSIACKFNRHIFTVSEFSKSEIIKRYKVKADKITVTYNGWQHFTREPANDSLLDKFTGLEKSKYFFAMSSVANNKNFKWVIEAARSNPEYTFVIAGYFDEKRFGESLKTEGLSNLRFLGYVSDAEAKALMKNCRAFLFPSLYEGFGLPPLEAMSKGARVIVSHTSCLPEVYGDGAYYIDPLDYNVDLEEILNKPVSPAEKTLDRYSWESSAEKIFKEIYTDKYMYLYV